MKGVVAKFEEYRAFVQSHPKEIKRAEEMAKMGFMFAPVSKLGVYSETINESLYAILGNVSSLHDHLIHSPDSHEVSQNLEEKQNEMKAKISSVNLSKITVTWLVLRLRMFLTFLANTEVALEMAIRQFISQIAHRRFIKVVEWLKVFSRCCLLVFKRRANGRKQTVLVSGGQHHPKSWKESKLREEIMQKKALAENAIKSVSELSDVPEITEITEDSETLLGDQQRNSKSSSSMNLLDEQLTRRDPAVSMDLPKVAYWVGKRTGKKYRLPDHLKHLSNASPDEVEPDETGDSSSQKSKRDTTRSNLSKGKESRHPLALEADLKLNLLGEVLHIFRPVIYLHLHQLFHTEKKRTFLNWFPWLTSLVVEVVSMRLTSVAATTNDPAFLKDRSDASVVDIMKHKVLTFDSSLKSTSDEVEDCEHIDIEKAQLHSELNRRRILLFLYMMRSPWYERFTLSTARYLQDIIKKLPMTDGLGNVIEDTLDYYHNAHFYISGS